MFGSRSDPLSTTVDGNSQIPPTPYIAPQAYLQWPQHPAIPQQGQLPHGQVKPGTQHPTNYAAPHSCTNWSPQLPPSYVKKGRYNSFPSQQWPHIHPPIDPNTIQYEQIDPTFVSTITPCLPDQRGLYGSSSFHFPGNEANSTIYLVPSQSQSEHRDIGTGSSPFIQSSSTDHPNGDMAQGIGTFNNVMTFPNNVTGGACGKSDIEAGNIPVNFPSCPPIGPTKVQSDEYINQKFGLSSFQKQIGDYSSALSNQWTGKDGVSSDLQDQKFAISSKGSQSLKRALSYGDDAKRRRVF
jgi:hypothetical protein